MQGEVPSLQPTPGSAAAATASSISSTERALLTRAETLLKNGDIGGARLVLQRAMEADSSRAAFLLAESYDPTQLPRWQAQGVRGDWAQSQALYARAHAGGIKEAKDRIAPAR